MRLNRRRFLGTAAASAALLSSPIALGQKRPRVVIIGGGAGGATAARYIAKDSDGAIEVILIEPSRTYYTCFFSNLAIGGFQPMSKLAHSYGTLASEYGVTVVHDWASDVDREKKEVRLAGGDAISYDRLVLSPGIDFVKGAIEGWDVTAQTKMPHAYKAGTQTQLLKAQVEAMTEGGTFAMVAPPNPYRCPPGPYERVSMVAHVLKQRNPTAKILILDPKEKFSKQGLFMEGWENHYTGMVDWLTDEFTGGVQRVDPNTMEIVLEDETIKADVCNVIPAMRAGSIAQQAGLTNEAGWCPIVPATLQSQMDENIHVLGDATQNGDMPKSGYSANSQAKAAAMAIRHALTGSRAFKPRFSNTCWSLISPDNGVKVGASYVATDEKIAKVDGFISQNNEDDALRKQTYEESLGWYAGMTADMFG
ncbi:Sulfide dehydrogenase [flavocytochrome c] flavoprotein chain precursor [Pseudovibrio sp. Ad13]|uniref:NAD(P)/FAD-dependent oxidoreductase n=1 Tax=Pseudovibrio sp. Ad13 TaxID=989396 RepID=UPI0007AE3A11|nr:NAD(P)/FAD-dependent oxidoreductase [Pseudovibrio sp. Ad13]KZK84972.1 Sulfide dehydrogenase [flavocytochrome c] flavoprotein chain precursor [Pseudovibrio sp. Ad13]